MTSASMKNLLIRQISNTDRISGNHDTLAKYV